MLRLTINDDRDGLILISILFRNCREQSVKHLLRLVLNGDTHQPE